MNKVCSHIAGTIIVASPNDQTYMYTAKCVAMPNKWPVAVKGAHTLH